MFFIIAIIIASILTIKNRCYVTSNGIFLNSLSSLPEKFNETFIISSVWNYSQLNLIKCQGKSRNKYFLLLLIMCTDIETHPGPGPAKVLSEINSLLSKIVYDCLCLKKCFNYFLVWITLTFLLHSILWS